jgi:hypothetical protein
MIEERTRARWYAAGLHFECTACGACCSGPGEGYIWVTRPEIELIAKHLDMPEGQLRREFLRRVGLRVSIVEDRRTKDCIFLRQAEGKTLCRIYPVRPNQCRTWPFWTENLASANTWNEAAKRCPGINRGRLYTFNEIETIRKSRRWWEDPNNAADSSKT